MNEEEKYRTSKFLSLVLRHKPEEIGLPLDVNGWADVDELISRCAVAGKRFSAQELEEIVATNDKKRFAYNSDKSKIRASQGHSIDVELQLEVKEPPELLFHGTVEKFLPAIKSQGLLKMKRQHVHLSRDRATAEKVGERRGEAIILIVRSDEMNQDGFVFYQSANGVWLTDHVPAKYIDF
ncbi:RNA 2'-phosphotransferase [Flavitalea sp. BT771]|uniref:RNA 2'-phosphotransferase n=1 Tax=Flavitalea sp. BT771 TaxID=3063329 RepID=UPI0026E44AE0|nr:RNA 2'-phosphotransferase [Flavitalea sp. BT771]MDO6431064.1 RNA 2'-phosphotransferase [Flavitalea sp. BT771]MDV6219971.1 RNA 2'-phosphotransferase [Flavitalea sp. BT771]